MPEVMTSKMPCENTRAPTTMNFRKEFYFYGFYRCVNASKSLTNSIKPEGVYVKFVLRKFNKIHKNYYSLHIIPILSCKCCKCCQKCQYFETAEGK